MNSDMVKHEKFGHLQLVYHFTVPLINPVLSAKTMKILRSNDVLLFNFILPFCNVINLNETTLKSFKIYF